MVRSHTEHAVARVTQFQDVFDQVIFMCGNVQEDGTMPQAWPPSERRELVSRFRDLGVSTLNAYGEKWDGGFPEAAGRPGLMDIAIQNMVAECEQTGSDGVDIDLEALPATARHAYSEFIANLSRELHARGKMLSICTAAPSRARQRDSGVGFLDTSVVGFYADHLRPMNYDFFWPFPNCPGVGPTSTALWVRDRMQRLVQEVPRHKVIMGLPTYSLDWNVNQIEHSKQIYDFEWIVQREKESGRERSWCSGWDVHLIRYTDAQGHAHLLWLSDAKSTKSHLETADDLDVAGVCFWCLKGDDPWIWETVREHFRR
jgi:spore germination protein